MEAKSAIEPQLQSAAVTQCVCVYVCVCEADGGAIEARIVIAPSDVVAVHGVDEVAEFECVVNARSVSLVAGS